MTRRRTQIKICGVRDAATARVVVEAGADYLGLVFVPASPRYVTVEQARTVLRELNAVSVTTAYESKSKQTSQFAGQVQPVGLFADHPLEQVRSTAKALHLKMVQLHGDETPEFVKALAPLQVIKALPFDAATFKQRLQPWCSPQAPANLHGLLLDAPQGGSGQTFDWSALALCLRNSGLHALPPIFLAGGLTPDNVTQAITTVRPFAVDVSSGVESSRGIKSPDKIRAFCSAVRRADFTHPST